MRKRKRKHVLRDASIRSQFLALFAVLLCVLSAHIVAMHVFEGLNFEDALWLTVTSATTVGYGDLYAKTWYGRVSTIVLLYVAGIAILAQVAAMYFEYRQELRTKILKGNWSWNMENHIVFLNCPEAAGDDYFYQAISQLRSSGGELANTPIIIVSDVFKDGIPDKLREMDVAHVNKAPCDHDAFEAASLLDANTVVILSRRYLDAASDSMNFELIDRVRSAGFKGRLISEVTRDDNRERFKKSGADNVLRPIRSYPELLMRAILAPGAEQIMENIFNSDGEECIRYLVSVNATWSDIVRTMVCEDVGTPLAYENDNGEIIANEKPHHEVNTKAIFTIVRDGNVLKHEQVQEKLDSDL